MDNKKTYHIGADIIRIIAGIGVLIIHVTDPFLTYPPYVGMGGLSWWIINIINTFFRVSVPLFVALSGYLLLDIDRKFDNNTFYRKRFLRIGVPAIFWIVLYFITGYWIGEITFFGDIIKKLATANLDHLHFLLIILELYFITPALLLVLKNISKKGNTILIISTLILIIGNGLTNEFYPKDAVNLQKSAFTIFIPYIFYYLLGAYLKNRKISLSSGISLGLIYLYTTIFIAILSSGIVGSYFRTSYSITVIFLTVISFIVLIQFNYIKYLTENERIIRVVKYIASLVFGAYLVHMMVIMVTDRSFDLVPGNITSPMWLYVVLKICIVVFISFIITAIAKKIPFVRFLFAG
jgi:surface polysaccharide O-acyltransferase-like enzyme